MVLRCGGYSFLGLESIWSLMDYFMRSRIVGKVWLIVISHGRSCPWRWSSRLWSYWIWWVSYIFCSVSLQVVCCFFEKWIKVEILGVLGCSRGEGVIVINVWEINCFFKYSVMYTGVLTTNTVTRGFEAGL